jgi:3-methylcrotonyl-CoA carboxylase alpha subunit
MFRKILIANRGEIACRVIQTAKRLGITTVGIYSQIDSNSKHVNMSDYAYYVGGNKSAESYLNMNRIIEVALNSGAEAIHPGYGFLSENCDFVKLCEQNKIKFIGPSYKSIYAMGSKIESKKIMENAKIPVVPGYFGDNQDKDFLIETARKISYPILIKADLGGGGKGMRIVHNENEFFEALSSAQNESSKSFGSAKILLEKYIANSRHIEVQVFGDNYNNHVHLYERDCTIQRRHQKVIEEAPSYLIDDIRTNLCETAVKVAKAVDYVNAGTVEFIYDIDQKKFYFMEMNTRLQVEHPISEMITREDFVEWQLLIASGGRLPKLQNEIKKHGHAMEARIYSEDPDNGFLPGTGKVFYLHEPNHRYSLSNPDHNVRIETAIREGDEVSVFYDPMISKLVCWAPTRDLCIKKMQRSLENYKILGLTNNIKFLMNILKQPHFLRWDFDTNFIAKFKDELINIPEELKALDVLATVMAKLAHEVNTKIKKEDKITTSPWDIKDNFRVNYKGERVFKLKFHNNTNPNTIEVTVKYLSLNTYNVKIIGLLSTDVIYQEVKLEQDGNLDMIISIKEDSIIKAKYYITPDNNIRVLKSDGSITNLDFIAADYGITEDQDHHNKINIKTPMPCSVAKVLIKAGDIVKKGQTLCTLEAMKMEHVIKSPRDGKIKHVYAKEATFMDANSTILDFE